MESQNKSFTILFFDIFNKEERSISVSKGVFTSEPTERTIDLRNYVVVPAFIDAHAHPISLSIKYNWYDLSDVRSKRDLLNLIGEYSERKKAPFIGYNFDESKWIDDKTYPTRKEIDDVAPDIPVLLIRIDGHFGVVNTKAIDTLRLSRHIFANYNYGFIVEDNLYETVSRFIRIFNIVPSEDALDEFIRNGISLVCDMDMAYPVPEGTMNRFAKRINIYYYRVLEKLEGISESSLTEILHRYRAKRLGIKMFADGSIGARTAYLFEPYTDDPSNKGKLLLDGELLSAIVRAANKARVQLAIHAIGDAAIDIVIRSLSWGDPELRHRIEHFEMPREDHIKELARHHIIPSMQPNFIANWQHPGGLYERRLGWERAGRMNPLRTILENSKIIAFGSDCMPIGPLYGIYGAMTHPLEHERLSFVEAVMCYTSGSAYAIFMEDQIGKIETGFESSFAVINLRPESISSEDVRDSKILALFRQGVKVFGLNKF